MKIAIVYNRESRAVINLFGVPNREKYGLETIRKIRDALKKGGHKVRAFEGDKNIVKNLEEFMPAVIAGERPGLVFNLSYGIQGKSRYTHIPGLLEMLGIPYVGSGPQTHAIALDKVMTKMIFLQKGLPTPRFAVLDCPDSEFKENLAYPLIVKPKDEAVSFGLKIVHDEDELRQGVQAIYDMFHGPTLIEEYIPGREINVGLLGNDPVEALPAVELNFGEGIPIYTHEDKVHKSGRTIEKICPASLTEEQANYCKTLAVEAFKSIGCYDSARVDFRMDEKGDFYILEINSMASLGPGGSYVYAADKIGLDYAALVNRLVEITTKRYFGAPVPVDVKGKGGKTSRAIFDFLTIKRDKTEDELRKWTNFSSRTRDIVGVHTVARMLGNRLQKLGLFCVDDLSNGRTAWTWQTKAGLKQGTLFVVTLDVPTNEDAYPMRFRRDPEWLYGEGIASSRAGIASLLCTFDALRFVKKIRSVKAGVFAYCDEGEDMRYSSGVLRQAARYASQVIVINTGYLGGKIIDQHRGVRKYSLVVEGDPLRSGHRRGEDALSWFLQKAAGLKNLSKPAHKLSVSVEDVHSERYSKLLPHKVHVTLCISYLDSKKADLAENQIKAIFSHHVNEIKVIMERLVDRPPLNRTGASQPLKKKLKSLCEDWNLPFGTESSLLPSPAGEIPTGTPVLAGFASPGRDIYTPNEAVHRGEFLQRTLLLSLLLTEG
jgi:D-alanine-D-alanine ligase